MKTKWNCIVFGAFSLVATASYAAQEVPDVVKMPGTQPEEVFSKLTPHASEKNRLSLDPVSQCTMCHGGFNRGTEPEYNWQGSMMSHAARDPIFWATLAVAEQDFDGSGDLCLRCHTSGAWLAGRSEPTDGSALTARDVDGVECDTCHRMTDPDGSEHKGVQRVPFIAQSGTAKPEAHYGAAQFVIWPGIEKLGPYADIKSRHRFMQSKFHRSPDFCGTCHDVSNPVTGDLAHNHGAQVPLEPGTFSGVLGSPLGKKAAFNNPPYKFGVVERTYSEFMASNWPQTAVKEYASLPAPLQAGVVKRIADMASAAGTNGDYEDGDTRYFTCQTCHMPPVRGADTSTLHNSPVTRKDLPLHDLTGGNYWMPDVIQYMDAKGTLRHGGGLTGRQTAALEAGAVRAKANLAQSATLAVDGNNLRVVNLTGHKLISGYPEGRRMWLNIKWYGTDGELLREDGAYGPIEAVIDGKALQVNTILDLDGTHTRIYEAKGAMTQRWAQQLLELGKPGDLVVSFDRQSGQPKVTLASLAQMDRSAYEKSFHFVLNNYLAKDNRIPPYGMRYAEARKRNALPVPACQFGCPEGAQQFDRENKYLHGAADEVQARGGGPDRSVYNYYDDFELTPPDGAHNAEIRLLYQPTSWEYVQFLYLANQRKNEFLAEEGANLLDAWLQTGMAEPYVMATTSWPEHKEAP